MSYDICLKDKVSNEVANMKHPQYIRGGTVPARINPITGILEQDTQIKAKINITYNYAKYYYDATEGDTRFAHDEVSCYYADGTTGPIKTEYGIRGLYGKTAAESIQMLTDMIQRITSKYMDSNGEWLTTERKRIQYLKNGKEVNNPIHGILHGEVYEKIEETYYVSEGDTSKYWEPTAANAILTLETMLVMAVDNILDENIVWDGD